MVQIGHKAAEVHSLCISKMAAVRHLGFVNNVLDKYLVYIIVMCYRAVRDIL